MEGFDPLIKKAGHFARRAHWGQRRKYRATPYSHHTFRVARRVARHEIGSPVTVAAALLHDTVEDTKVDLSAIMGEFGPDVSRLVDELTKLEQDMNLSRTTRFEREIDRLKGISREAKVITNEITNQQTFSASEPASGKARERRQRKLCGFEHARRSEAGVPLRVQT